VGASAATSTLRVHAASSLAAGFQVGRSTAGWSESTITWNTRPAVVEALGSSGPIQAGTWVEVPLTGLVTGDGTYDLVLTPLSTTALRLDSRETPTPPELLIRK
jgi:hypothetical protein